MTKFNIMSKKIIFERKDCDYTVQITTDWQPELIKVEPSKLGTQLNKNDVIELISVLSNWLYETNKK